MKLDSLTKLYVHQLKDLWSAENQILEAMPKAVDAARDDELKQALSNHLKETQGQIGRLETIFQGLEFAPGGERCEAAAGLIAELEGLLDADFEQPVLDAGLIASVQRIEHYEMAGYGCVRTYAEKLGHQDAADLLQKSLDEEAAADQHLSRLAERRLNFEAMVA